MSLLESKSLLAKLMATEDLLIQQAKVPTASFNVETRVLTVPILDQKLSKDVYDLFMGHEVGHALYTPLKGMKKAVADKINMAVANIVEDSRIERKIKNKYPGIRAPFIKAYGELYEKNFFETQGKDLNDYNFIDRVNLHCKIGASLAISFTDEERELLNEVETTETYKDVIRVTKKICDFMNLQQEEELQTIKVKVLVDGNDESEGKQEQEINENGDDDEIIVDARSKDGDDTEEKEEKSEKDIEATVKVGGTAAGNAGRDENRTQPPPMIRSFTDEAYRKNEKNLFDTSGTEIVYANIPFYDTKKGIFDYKEVHSRVKNEGFTIPREIFTKYRRESSKVVSYLVKEFELRKNAEQMKRASTAKSGDLDLSKIYSYNFNEDIFKKITTVPNGQSHGLVLFLDWSGSMAKHIGNTVKQLLNLALFCKKVNIPFEVYCFIEYTDPEFLYRPHPKDGDIRCGSLGVVNLLSSRMSATEFITGGAMLMKIAGLEHPSNWSRVVTPTFLRMSGTPLNEAVIAAMEIVPEFQKKNRLQIVNTVFLTDGEGTGLYEIYDRSGYSKQPKFTHMVLRDPKTRNEEIFDIKKYKTYTQVLMYQTDCLIRLLKKRTNSHVIGFFVCETKDLDSRFTYFYPKENNSETIKDKFRKDRYSIVTNTGFDDYYLLRSNGLDTEDEELTFKDNATTRGMVTAFSKYAGNKVSSRVVLNRFIGLIS